MAEETMREEEKTAVQMERPMKNTVRELHISKKLRNECLKIQTNKKRILYFIQILTG